MPFQVLFCAVSTAVHHNDPFRWIRSCKTARYRWLKSDELKTDHSVIGGVHSSEKEVKRDVASQCEEGEVQMDEVRWIKSRSLCIGGVYSSEREVKRDVASQSEEGKVVHLCDVLVLDASAQEVTWDIGTPGEADRVVHLQGVPVLDPGSLELLRPYAYQRREASRYPPGSLRSQMVI
ncbi:hypothetical protein HGM15179_014134 [Zosterops borbonicus]|uniref:Uncharacterized protein n=1 Tax=Zosterops borbonicus TaxID=364589 RepID=A0A8K1G735_9PASS|nr:hypothetical protein HGM15179_014134 [Zosterops borbonicus]